MMYSFASASASASTSACAGGTYYSGYPRHSKRSCGGYDGCDTSNFTQYFGRSGHDKYGSTSRSMASAWANAFSNSGWMDAWGSSSSRAGSRASSYDSGCYDYSSYGKGNYGKACYDTGNYDYSGYGKGGYSDYDYNYTDAGDTYTNYDNDTAIDDSYNTNSYNTYDDSFNTYVDNSVTNNYYNYILNSGNKTNIEDSGNVFNANVTGGRASSNSQATSNSSSTSQANSSSNSTGRSTNTGKTNRPCPPSQTTPQGNPDWAKFEGDPIVTTKYGKYHVPLKTGQTKTLVDDPSDHSKLSVTGGKSQGATIADYTYNGIKYSFNARDGAVYQGDTRLGSLKDKGHFNYDIGGGRQIVSRNVKGKEVFAVRGGDSEYYYQLDQRSNSKDPYWNLYMAENRDSAANDATGVPEVIRGLNHR
ncbi:MAG: hypothetical protein ACKO37_02945 [Vampirovibrionales bacterium]